MGLTAINTPAILSRPRVLADDLTLEVLGGLQRKVKILPTRLFYDQRGSRLFDQICQTDEYYPTRTEIAIMEQNIQEIAGVFGVDSALIEYGSGSSTKTRLLLDHLPDLAAYVPVDISRGHLFKTAGTLERLYPNLLISPLCQDFTLPFSLPPLPLSASRKLAYFPGSTIGNFTPSEAVAFMRRVAHLVGPGGGFLIGIDLQKDPTVLYRAYNDRQGVTAAFNLNILTHINRVLQANFVESQFEHLAFYNQRAGRIEMHLVSQLDQVVTLNGSRIHIRRGERILTEVSYKYTLSGFREMAARAGFDIRQTWEDPREYFSVQYLVAT